MIFYSFAKRMEFSEGEMNSYLSSYVDLKGCVLKQKIQSTCLQSAVPMYSVLLSMSVINADLII